MRVLVCNRSDPASTNLRDRILELGDWEATNRTFRGAAVWSQSEAILVEVEGPTVMDERLDPDLRALGLPLRDVWFLSKHRAGSGQPSLTVHPIGNHGEAAFGGQPGVLSPAAPRDMGALLRRIRHHREGSGLPHQVTYEATHHGPRMTLPSLFLEIGSDEAWYSDRASAEVVARAVQEVLRGEGRSQGPVLVGVGGGHYAPRHTDVALAGHADFGHLLPAHAVEAAAAGASGSAESGGPVGPGGQGWAGGEGGEGAPGASGSAGGAEALRRCIEATPGCAGVHIHKKGLSGPQRALVVGWCEELGVKVWEGLGA